MPHDDEPVEPDLDLVLLDARQSEAARTRSQRRHLREIAESSATLSAALLDLAEHRARVIVTTVDGSTHAGIVQRATTNLVTLQRDAARIHLDHLAIASVRRSDGGKLDATGDRRPEENTSLEDALSECVLNERSIRILLQGMSPIHGEVLSVGDDAAVVRTHNGDALLSLASVIGFVEEAAKL